MGNGGDGLLLKPMVAGEDERPTLQAEEFRSQFECDAAEVFRVNGDGIQVRMEPLAQPTAETSQGVAWPHP